MNDTSIVEAGSTFTKAYVIRDGRIESRGMINIEFKKNLTARGAVGEDDMSLLIGYVKELYRETGSVHVLGTSSFRKLAQPEVENVRNRLAKIGKVSFEVVSANDENALTSYGAVQRISYPGQIGVMVGGGGSTEVSVYAEGQLVASALSPIGVGDVNQEFPDLAEETAKSRPLEVAAWISERLSPISTSAGLLVLAGGDFPLLYRNAKYPLDTNPYSDDPEKAFILLNSRKNERDNDYFAVESLSKFRKLTPDTPRWWDGTRAMCAFVNAVATQLGATILLPTRISMIYGVAARLEDS